MAQNLSLVVIWAISAFLSDMSKNIKMELKYEVQHFFQTDFFQKLLGDKIAKLQKRFALG